MSHIIDIGDGEERMNSRDSQEVDLRGGSERTGERISISWKFGIHLYSKIGQLTGE